MKNVREIKKLDSKVFSDFRVMDTDGDNVYDVFDCNPHDKRFQDDFYDAESQSTKFSQRYYEPEEVRKRLNRLHILEGSRY